MKEKRINNNALTIIGIILLIISIIGISYAIFNVTLAGNKENSITTGDITLTYTEPSSALTITGAQATDDNVGKESTKYFDFSITSHATGNVTVGYYIYIEENASNTLSANAVKLYLSTVTNTSDAPSAEIQTIAPTLAANLTPFNPDTMLYDATAKTKILTTNTFAFINGITNQSIYNYRLKMWLDSSFVQDTTYSGTCSNTTYTTPETCEANNETWTETTNNTHQVTTTSQTYSIKVHVKGIDGTPKTITAS